MTDMLECVRKSICSNLTFDEIGTDRYLLHTDMYCDDGDELHIVMECSPESILLTDEGHTLMWLSYEDFDFTNDRTKLLTRYVHQNDVELNDGRIQVRVDGPDRVGPALSSLIQAMLQVAFMRNLSRNR